MDYGNATTQLGLLEEVLPLPLLDRTELGARLKVETEELHADRRIRGRRRSRSA